MVEKIQNHVQFFNHETSYKKEYVLMNTPRVTTSHEQAPMTESELRQFKLAEQTLSQFADFLLPTLVLGVHDGRLIAHSTDWVAVAEEMLTYFPADEFVLVPASALH